MRCQDRPSFKRAETQAVSMVQQLEGSLFPNSEFRRIATEEAFQIPKVSAQLKAVARGTSRSSDMPLLRRIYASSNTYYAGFFAPLEDIADGRIADMDAELRRHAGAVADGAGRPDVRCGYRDEARARIANDRLAEAIARHRRCFAGLARVRAEVAEACREGRMERAEELRARPASIVTRTRTTNTSTIRSTGRSSRPPKRSTAASTSIRADRPRNCPVR